MDAQPVGGKAAGTPRWYTSRVLLGSLVLSVVLGLPLAADGGQPLGRNLPAAAAATGRPPECSAGSRRAVARGPTVWERARTPNLQRYCDLLARGHAQLASAPQAASESARLADEALAGYAAPVVLLARAALSLGSPEEAARHFARARSIDRRSLDDPSTLHDLAKTLALVGQRREALEVYRALVPRIDLLGGSERRVAALLAAAHVAMAAAGADRAATSGAGARGGVLRPEPRLDEAIAYLREARQRQPAQLANDVLLSLVLALDRSGDKAQAEAALDESVGRVTSSSAPAVRLRASEYLAAEEDRLALEALALERAAPLDALQRWEAYLAGAGGKGPWAPAARARADALRQRAGGGARRAAATHADTGARAPAGRTR